MPLLAPGAATTALPLAIAATAAGVGARRRVTADTAALRDAAAMTELIFVELRYTHARAPALFCEIGSVGEERGEGTGGGVGCGGSGVAWMSSVFRCYLVCVASPHAAYLCSTYANWRGMQWGFWLFGYIVMRMICPLFRPSIGVQIARRADILESAEEAENPSSMGEERMFSIEEIPYSGCMDVLQRVPRLVAVSSVENGRTWSL